MKTIKVYHAPGYPIDPAKEESRMAEGLSDNFLCTIVPPKPILLTSQMVDFTFGSQEEADAFLKMVARYQARK